MNKLFKYLIFSLSATALVACGGTSSTRDEGSSDNSVENKIQNILPKADAGEDMNITYGNPIILDASNSYDTNGTIVKYQWSNGTEIMGEEQSIVLDNLDEGIYTFTLTVTDDENATATDTIKVITYSDTVVVFETNQGNIELKMMSTVAPKAVENFVTHSKNGYYNGLTFHRVIKEFMIQGGDPKGNGTGGESIWGTAFEDETTPSVIFDRPFLLAMANAGRNTNGSQFFITTVETPHLNGKHTIFGEVISGKESVSKIEESGNANSKIIKAYIKFEINK